MSHPISIHLAVEDELSEWVLRRIIASRPTNYSIGAVFGKGGFGYLKRQVRAFNNAAKRCPFLLLTDPDQTDCPPQLIADWLGVPKHPDFLLRVAVREVESWLLGDHSGLSAFLGLRCPAEDPKPEGFKDPKQELLKLSFSSPRRNLREALAWCDKSSGRFLQGPDYNGTLSQFVLKEWNLAAAMERCPSLEKLVASLARLENAR